MLKIWICGAGGRVGRKMTDILASRPVELLLTDADSVDITDSEAVMEYAHINRPHYIVNCAGLTDAAACEDCPEEAYRVNALGATINMDGTAIMQGVAVVFASQAFGIRLSVADYLTVILTATLASVGTAGVPGVGLITLSMVFASVGLPVEAIALIMGIDRILDMSRTAVNITGDAVCTTVVAFQDGAVDKAVFDDAEAGRDG